MSVYTFGSLVGSLEDRWPPRRRDVTPRCRSMVNATRLKDGLGDHFGSPRTTSAPGPLPANSRDEPVEYVELRAPALEHDAGCSGWGRRWS
jgi:hypothetical protein